MCPLQPGWPTTYPSVVMMASDTITRSWVRTSASFTARLGFIIRGQKAENVLFMYLMQVHVLDMDYWEHWNTESALLAAPDLGYVLPLI